MFLRRGQFIDGIHPKHGPYPPFIYDVLCMQIFDASWKQKVRIQTSPPCETGVGGLFIEQLLHIVQSDECGSRDRPFR